jgi:hypothetical protein
MEPIFILEYTAESDHNTGTCPYVTYNLPVLANLFIETYNISFWNIQLLDIPKETSLPDVKSGYSW